MTIKGTLNFELTFNVNNLEELVRKTNLLERILTSEGLDYKVTRPDASDTKPMREESLEYVDEMPYTNQPNRSKYKRVQESARGQISTNRTSTKGAVEYLNSMPDEVSFTAKVVAFDDTFRSEETDPIWGLAFTSQDITEYQNIGAVLRNKQKVRMTIKKVKEGNL